MSTLSVLNKYLDRHTSWMREANYSEDTPSFHNIEHLKAIASRAQTQSKTLDVDGFEVTVILPAGTMKYDEEIHKDGVGEFYGAGSYLMRRKSDNQVISGYLKNLNRGNHSSTDQFEMYYGITQTQFDSLSEENILDIFQRDKLVSSFINDGVPIDNFTAYSEVEDLKRNISSFHEVHLARDGEWETGRLKRDVDERGVGFSQWMSNLSRPESDTWNDANYYFDVSAATSSADWLIKNGLITDSDKASFGAEMSAAINLESKGFADDVYFGAVKYGLPEEISRDDIVRHKYSSTELNFIRSKPDDPNPHSNKFRHQYIDKMRSYFGIGSVHDFNNVSTSLKNAGLKVFDEAFPKDWALHTFLLTDQTRGYVGSGKKNIELVQERIDSISEGRIMTKEFLADSGVAQYSKRSFENFMLMVSANRIYNGSFRDMVQLTTLPKEIFDPTGFTAGETASEQYRFAEMVKTLAPYLSKYAEELNEAKDALKATPSLENKVALKKLADKYKWLSRGGNNLENYYSTNEKLKGDTLRDFGSIMGGYLGTIEKRVAREVSSDADEVFTVSIEQNESDVVKVDSSKLFEQHLETIEGDERDYYIKSQAYRDVEIFVTEHDLDLSVVLSGTDCLNADEETIELDGSDMSTIKGNVEEHYPDLEEEFDWVASNMDEYGAGFDITDMHASPADLCGDAALWSIKKDSSDYRSLLEMNERAHIVQSQTQRELASYGAGGNFNWTPLFEGEVEIGDGLSMSVISDKQRLIDEADTMQHCVLSYFGKAVSGECILLSVTNDDGERLATVELETDDLEEFTLAQCLGYRNESVSIEVDEAVSAFVDTLNEEPEELGLELADEIVADVDLDDVERNPALYANAFSTIAFDTDAAHLSYYVLGDLTPESFSVESFICDQGWSELFYSSKFSKDINVIDQLVMRFKEHEVTPQEVIALNTKGRLDFNMDALEKELVKGYAPKQHFWDQVNEIGAEENVVEKDNPALSNQEPKEAPTNQKNKGMKM